jgi:predicted O-methyltransferase YrrM
MRFSARSLDLCSRKIAAGLSVELFLPRVVATWFDYGSGLSVVQPNDEETVMNDARLALPAALNGIERETAAVGFTMISEHKTGALLRTLAASKPGGVFLELGTGTGASTSWILDGMDIAATLLTVDNEARYVEIAQRHLGHDRRVTFHVDDGISFLRGLGDRQFDLIFADTWPGKFDHLEDALKLLSPGGLYVIDDLLPQPNWPDGHTPRVLVIINELEADSRLVLCKLCWSSGIIIATRRAAGGG